MRGKLPSLTIKRGEENSKEVQNLWAVCLFNNLTGMRKSNVKMSSGRHNHFAAAAKTRQEDGQQADDGATDGGGGDRQIA